MFAFLVNKIAFNEQMITSIQNFNNLGSYRLSSSSKGSPEMRMWDMNDYGRIGIAGAEGTISEGWIRHLRSDGIGLPIASPV